MTACLPSSSSSEVFGGSALYGLLFRSSLVPRFISVWGLIAVVLLVAANVVALDPSGDFQPAMLLFLPMVLNEPLLAVWLIVKGFTSSAADPARREIQPGVVAA
jgi:ABC-type iron transport system FetAB permease component